MRGWINRSNHIFYVFLMIVIAIIVVTWLIMWIQKCLWSCCSRLPMWTDVTGIVIAVAGVGFALYQWHRQISEKRAEFLNTLLQRFSSDSIQDFLRRGLEPSVQEEWFSKSYLTNADFRQNTDAAFNFFAQLCYLMNRGMIERDEFDFFGNQIGELLKSPETIQYLLKYVLLHHDCKMRTPYASLIVYGKSLGIEDDLYSLSNDDGSYNDAQYAKLRERLNVYRVEKDAQEAALPATFFNRNADEPIGRYVQRIVPEIVRKLPREEIEKLKSEDYCRKKLGLIYPMLKDAFDAAMPRWHRRYYSQIIDVYEMSLRITNEWKEKHSRHLKQWLDDHNLFN